MTIEQVVNWVLENRSGTAFKDYSPEKIAQEISECIDQNAMLTISDNGNIVGIVCGAPDVENKVFYVFDILAIKKGAVKQMMKVFHSRFKGFEIRGLKKTGKKRTFKNTERLQHLL